VSNDDYRDFESEDIDRAQYAAEEAEEREAPMDPNETLRELRGMISDAQDFNADIDGDLMAEKFEALDAWLSRGGWLPDAWELDGTSGQDRKTYSDDQDRDNYTTGE
jgi:hypothetical protein